MCISCANRDGRGVAGGRRDLLDEQFRHGQSGLAIAVKFGNFEGDLISVRGEKAEGGAIVAGGIERHGDGVAFTRNGLCAGENHLTDAHAAGDFRDGNRVEVRDDRMRPGSKRPIQSLERDDGKTEPFAFFFRDDRPRGASVNHGHDRLPRRVGPTRERFMRHVANEFVVVRPAQAYRQ